MDNYRHHLSAFFAHKAQAERTVSKLIDRGLPAERISLFTKNSALPAHTAKNSSDKVLKDIVVDGAIGTAVGTGLGALVEVALVASNVSLFIASPVLAPLVLLGWGASIGGIVGASLGAAEKAKPLSDLVRDAILQGQTVVVVETKSIEETKIAGEILQAEVGDYTDVA